MSTKTESVNSKVETLDINLDEIFDAAPSAADVTLPQEEKPNKNIFSGTGSKTDMSFADPDVDDKDDLNVKADSKEESSTEKEVAEPEVKAEEVKEEVNIDDVISSIDEEDSEEEKIEKKNKV